MTPPWLAANSMGARSPQRRRQRPRLRNLPRQWSLPRLPQQHLPQAGLIHAPRPASLLDCHHGASVLVCLVVEVAVDLGREDLVADVEKDPEALPLRVGRLAVHRRRQLREGDASGGAAERDPQCRQQDSQISLLEPSRHRTQHRALVVQDDVELPGLVSIESRDGSTSWGVGQS